MKCPHCNYEDEGTVIDGDYVASSREHDEHFRVECSEVVLEQDSNYNTTVQPDIVATRGYGWMKETRNVYACAACGILFICI